jgi:hypothetical protein
MAKFVIEIEGGRYFEQSTFHGFFLNLPIQRLVGIDNDGLAVRLYRRRPQNGD